MPTHGAERSLLAILACSALTCASAGPAFQQSARNDVPAQYAQLANPVPEIPPERIRYFARRYKAQCSRCHGIDGQGGGERAAGRKVPPRDFTDAAFMATRTDGQLFYQILTGGGERSEMPAYGPGSDVGWSEEKVWNLVRFIRRFAHTPNQAR